MAVRLVVVQGAVFDVVSVIGALLCGFAAAVWRTFRVYQYATCACFQPAS
jgi:hypothetical protein